MINIEYILIVCDNYYYNWFSFYFGNQLQISGSYQLLEETSLQVALPMDLSVMVPEY